MKRQKDSKDSKKAHKLQHLKDLEVLTDAKRNATEIESRAQACIVQELADLRDRVAALESATGVKGEQGERGEQGPRGKKGGFSLFGD